MIDVRVGDIIKFKSEGYAEIFIGRVNSVGATYDKPFHTKCDPIFYVKVMGFNTDFIVKLEDIVEVFITPEVVQFS